MNGPPDAGKYEALIEKLTDIAQCEQRAEINPLTASYDALRAVNKFLHADKRALEREATRPLIRLTLAVQDRLQGARPRLLFDPRGKKGGAPTHTSGIIRRTIINGAFLVLRKGDMSREEAGNWLATELKRNGIRQPNGKPITARTVMRWGAELRGKSPAGSDEFFASFMHSLRQSFADEEQDDAPLDSAGAKLAARPFIKLLKLGF